MVTASMLIAQLVEQLPEVVEASGALMPPAGLGSGSFSLKDFSEPASARTESTSQMATMFSSLVPLQARRLPGRRRR
jgi:hypothetical protein